MTQPHLMPADDQLAIMDLITRYNDAVGEGKPDEVVACFTENGYVNGRHGLLRGHAELRKAGMLATSELKLRHIINNILIRAHAGEQDVADVKCNILYYEVTKAGIDMKASGVYADVVVNVDGQWKFQSRVMTPSLGGTWPGQTL